MEDLFIKMALLMACTLDFFDFISSQIAETRIIRSRKMFGDYMIYVNENPLILACYNIAYVKTHPATTDLQRRESRMTEQVNYWQIYSYY